MNRHLSTAECFAIRSGSLAQPKELAKVEYSDLERQVIINRTKLASINGHPILLALDAVGIHTLVQGFDPAEVELALRRIIKGLLQNEHQMAEVRAILGL